MSAAPDDLDALLVSLLVAPASASEPEVAPAPAVAVLLPPALSVDAESVQAALRAWLDDGAPGGIWQVPELGPHASQAEPLEPEILLELAAARAWQVRDQEAFDRALARLPAGRAEHHRRMAGVCDFIKTKQQAGATLAPTPEGRS